MNNFDEQIDNFKSIPFEKLPDLELYIDQITTFLEEKLNCFKRNETDKAITKTMVNNYTKDKLLPVSNKKKYNKEHLIYLILIYHLKSALSIEDISKVISKTENNLDSLESFYHDFLELQQFKLDEVKKDIKNKNERIENLTNSNSKELNLTYLIYSLVLDIEMKKLLVEKIIDEEIK